MRGIVASFNVPRHVGFEYPSTLRGFASIVVVTVVGIPGGSGRMSVDDLVDLMIDVEITFDSTSGTGGALSETDDTWASDFSIMRSVDGDLVRFNGVDVEPDGLFLLFILNVGIVLEESEYSRDRLRFRDGIGSESVDDGVQFLSEALLLSLLRRGTVGDCMRLRRAGSSGSIRRSDGS